MRHELSGALVIPELCFSEEAGLLFRPVTCLSGCFCSFLMLMLLTPGITAGFSCQEAARENEQGAEGDSGTSRGLPAMQCNLIVPQQQQLGRSGDTSCFYRLVRVSAKVWNLELWGVLKACVGKSVEPFDAVEAQTCGS